MAFIQQYPDRSSTDSEDFHYPEPNYPYIYAPRSEAGYTVSYVIAAHVPRLTLFSVRHRRSRMHRFRLRRLHLAIIQVRSPPRDRSSTVPTATRLEHRETLS